MKTLHLLAVSAVMAALLILAAAEADAQQSSVFGARTPPPPRHHGGGFPGRHHGFGGGIWIIERDVPVVVEREVVREVVREVPADPPPAPRKPYAVGRSYASLPASCMKLIEGGASYYYCGGGEWYRLAGKQYLAVRRP